jgi:hypothetical protein
MLLADDLGVSIVQVCPHLWGTLEALFWLDELGSVGHDIKLIRTD